MDKRILTGKKREVKVKKLKIGGNNPSVFIAGPCSIESKNQIIETAIRLKEIGVNILRGGAFKPRTSPYSFQGLGLEGLKYLKLAGEKAKLPVVTELMDESHLDMLLKYSDIIQIGSRNMHNYSLLKAIGKTKAPILLKRGMCATIKEWIMAAEYIAAYGNENIILCERGIRSFDSYTRNTLDLAAVPIMKKETGLPIIVDPSHGTGLKELIKPMSLASLACGADGLMIEVHPDPKNALSDGEQSLNFEEYKSIVESVNID
ncbi:MAG: 3-deoxy-7-phosphoheptulonate synthase [Firmicutes bacterium]|nr:3-deoxy-7-phosphoheptulonate synthase [Bacillota bacterium]